MLARIRKSAEGKDQGFTLVELLVVMIIIGILAAVAIPVFLNQRKKAVDTSIKSDIRAVASDIETAYVDNQTYPAPTAWTVHTDATVGSAVKLTTGNVVQYKIVAGGYCLRGYTSTLGRANTTGTGAAGTYFFFDSPTGGLQPGAPAVNTALCTA